MKNVKTDHIHLETIKPDNTKHSLVTVLLESVTDAALLLDIKQEICHVNQAFHKLFSAKNAISVFNFSDLFQLNNSYFSKVVYSEALKEFIGSQQEGIKKFNLINHTLLIVETKVIASDIGEKEWLLYKFLVEEKLKESEEKYRFIAENSSDIIALYDENFKLKYISPSCYEVLGYTPVELTGIPVFHLVSSENKSKVTGILKKYVQQKSSDPFKHTYQVKHKNGKKIWLEAAIRIHFNYEGNVQEIITNSRSVDETIKIQQELKKSKQNLETLFSSLDDIVFLLDTQGRYLNAWYSDASKLAFPKEYFIGKTIREVFPDPFASTMQNAFKKVLHTKGKEFIEYQIPADNTHHFLAKIYSFQSPRQ